MNQHANISPLQAARAAVATAEQQLYLLEYYETQIRDACSTGLKTHSYDDVCRLVISGEYRINAHKNAFWISTLQMFPNCSVYFIFIAGGNLDDVKDAIPVMQAQAKALGADKISMAGRVGWKKIFEPMGAKTVSIVMELED